MDGVYYGGFRLIAMDQLTWAHGWCMQGFPGEAAWMNGAGML